MKRLLCIIVLLWGCNLDDSGAPQVDQGTNQSDMSQGLCNNNGMVEAGEQCDTDVPDGKSCASVGFGGGIAICTDQCKFDYSNCSTLASCGNGVLDDPEQCEAGLLNGETCQTRGFDEGELNCTNDCILDDSNCSDVCGNNEISNNETCDGTNLEGKTCATENGDGWIGDLKCSDDCQDFDTSDCSKITPQIISAREFNCRLKYDGKVDCWNSKDVMLNEGTYVKISTGSFHVCGLTNKGRVECWGENGSGQNDVPDVVFKDVIADGRFSCGLTLDGTIQCWGEDTEGQTTPPVGKGYTSLSGGKQHACAIDPDGAVICWGTWSGTTEFRFFAPVAGQPIFDSVTSGRYYDCGLDKEGEPVCWGELMQTAQRNGPFVKLSTNTFHTCGLRTSGEIDCWGENEFGKADSRPGPFIDVSAGYYHTCGMKADLSVECWGINPENIDISSQLYEKGQTTARPVP